MGEQFTTTTTIKSQSTTNLQQQYKTSYTTPTTYPFHQTGLTPKSGPEAFSEKRALLKLIRILPCTEQEQPRPTHKNTPYQKYQTQTSLSHPPTCPLTHTHTHAHTHTPTHTHTQTRKHPKQYLQISSNIVKFHSLQLIAGPQMSVLVLFRIIVPPPTRTSGYDSVIC